MERDRSASIVDANERASMLSQRMRDLYDFKTENEWPKRAGSSQRENPWISKSSSEEDRTNYQPVRRNSQDMEFNDRIERFKVRLGKVVISTEPVSCSSHVLRQAIHIYLFARISEHPAEVSRLRF